jgi:predicted nucleotide-binding protein
METSRSVFVVHGHDDGVKQAVARLLERAGLEPVILHEQPNRGAALIEKFEEHASRVSFAVVLLTPDDLGRSKSAKKALESRARQNVIFELGYFVGALRRRRVCALYVEGVALPSDVHGVLYVPYDPAGAWQHTLLRELDAANLPVDFKRALQ